MSEQNKNKKKTTQHNSTVPTLPTLPTVHSLHGQTFTSSTVADRRRTTSTALPGSDSAEIARSFFGRTTSSCLVQIQVDAYMFTLDRNRS